MTIAGKHPPPAAVVVAAAGDMPVPLEVVPVAAVVIVTAVRMVAVAHSDDDVTSVRMPMSVAVMDACREIERHQKCDSDTPAFHHASSVE